MTFSECWQCCKKKVKDYTTAGGMGSVSNCCFSAQLNLCFHKFTQRAKCLQGIFAMLAVSIVLATLANGRLLSTISMHEMVFYGASDHVSFVSLLLFANFL